ncbi:Uridine nucleosidase 1, partial [Camellia lanceoleosa]
MKDEALTCNYVEFLFETGGRPRVADFVRGSDGLGNISLPPPKSKKIENTASEFLVDMVSKYPGEVSILALGPLTNFALAMKRDSSFASKVKRVVILGGSFFALGNVNPAPEANGTSRVLIQLNQPMMVRSLLINIEHSLSRFDRLIAFVQICKFYLFCEAHEETVLHVMLHCQFVWKIWANFVSWWGECNGLFQ